MESYNEMKCVLEKIPDKKPIIIAGHENADMDSIGASLSMAYFLENLGKKDITVLIEEKDFYKIKWFNNMKFIASNIEKENYVFIMVDLNRKNRLGKYEKFFSEADYTINIDHHEANKKESKYILENADISSTCEIIYNLMNLFDKKIDKNIATLLYAGILTDTSGFSHRLTPETLKIAGELLKFDIDYKYITKKTLLERSIPEIKALSKILGNINFDVFHYVVMDRKDPIFKDLEYSQLFKKMVPILKNIENVDVMGIFLIEDDKVFGEYKANADIDVSKLAIQLGGGGHKNSAGFTSMLPFEEVIRISKDYISKYL